MRYKQRRQSKGLSLTISAVLEGLFFIGIVALGYWFLLSRILEIHVATLSSDNERHAINLANVLLSYEGVAYVNEGKIERGVLDTSKLDKFASRKGTSYDLTNKDFTSSALKNYKEISLGYPNTVSLVWVTDLESCSESTGCVVWVTTLVGPISVSDLTPVKFINCLSENFGMGADDWARRGVGCTAGALGGAFIGSIVPGIGTALGAAVGCGIGFLGTLWYPQDLQKCAINSMPESLKYFLSSGSFAAAEGLPTLVRYPDGTVHAGRIMVSVMEWR